MTILDTDIKLLESERMRDTQDGGGRMTSNEIPDGVAGNVFPKVSRLDSVYGRVNLRKIYAAVQAANTDVYAGAHAIITDPPNNDKIRCLLFSTADHFDDRQGARDRIESYVVAGPESRYMLYGNQLIGQKAITLFARPDEPVPDVGDVLCLSAESGAMAGTQQYVRISDVSSEVRTFEDQQGEFDRLIITCVISGALRYTFTGDAVARYSTHTVADAAKVRETQVADASKYYGVMPLEESADAGDIAIKVSSAYDALVPSATRETAVSLASVSGANPYLQCGAGTIIAIPWTAPMGTYLETVTLHLPCLPKPGSLILDFGYHAAWHLVFGVATDDGMGSISGSFNNEPISGTVDYETGIVSYVHPVYGSFKCQASCDPVVPVSEAAHTRDIEITLATRGTVYSETLLPIPAPGTLIVDYRALGRWYRLRDDGTGQLSGNSSGVGTGSLDYVTGGLVITLGALPDVDSSVLLAWGTPAHYKILTTDSSPMRKEFTLDSAPIKPDTVSLSWQEASVSKTATDDGLGVITGSTATGTIDYATGAVVMEFTRAPDDTVTITYDRLTDTHTATGGTYAAGAAIQPRSVAVQISFTMPDGTTGTHTATDDGLGNLRISTGYSGEIALLTTSHIVIGSTIIGTVNYAAGTASLTGTMAVTRRYWRGAPPCSGAQCSVSVGQWGTISDGNATVTATSWSSAKSSTYTGDTFEVGAGVALSVSLGKADPMYIVPGSVIFEAAGKTYVDRNGLLYTDIDYTTGSGTLAGTIDYETGATVLTDYATDQAIDLEIKSCLGRYGDWTMTEAQFRTPGSPVRPASFYVQAATADSVVYSGTADANGVITGTHVRGSINQTMGVVSVEFGQMLPPEGGGADVWTPQPVMPSTLRFSCVVQTSLPLDADLLGIDPVRLPSDGRVAIFRPGDVAVIHDTQLYTLVNPAVAGATYSVGRDDLSLLELIDANGLDVPTSKYTTDLDAGTVTMAADLSLTGYTQPLKARHRVEDMVLLADVQINGDITLLGALTHNYTSNSYLSSALPFGDLQAYVTTIFDQQTWTGEWSDTLIGSQSNAEYDDLNHPIEVLNESAVKERWRLNFTSSTAFQVYGENLGLIAAGDTSTDLAPVNSITGDPYFVLRAAGWGSGWSAGNQLRFNTQAGSAPIWIARTVLAGATLAGDSFDLAVRGDVD